MADVNGPTDNAQAIAASALRAQQARMRIIAENIANADSTAKTPGGTPIGGRPRCSNPRPWRPASRAWP